MDFKSILSHLAGPARENKIFYSEPEIQAQRDAVEKLKMSGVSQMVVEAQENRLREMEAKKQQPVDKAVVEDSLSFLKPQPPVTATPDMALKFPSANDVKSSFDVHVSDTTVPMNGRFDSVAPVQAGTPPPQMPNPEMPPMPPQAAAADGGGKSRPDISTPPELRNQGDVLQSDPNAGFESEDQAKRDELAAKQKKDRIMGMFPEAVAGFADAITASGAPYGTKGTAFQDKVREIDDKQQKEEKADFDKSLLTDPNSGMSKIAQSAAARLLGKKPEDMKGLSLAQIDKAFPIWKEALNNEQAMELKKMQMEAIKANKELAQSTKDEQFREKQIQQIRQNLTGHKAFGTLQEMNAKYGQLQQAANDPSAFGDLAIMFSFMKALDPTSVVREGEQERFIATASLPTAFANKLNKLASGKTLNMQQRKEVAEIAKQIRGNALDQYKLAAKPSLEQAKRLNYNLSEIDPMFEEEKTLPVVTSQAQYDALPVGSQYQTTDGKTGTKRK